jgi:hypothetical protein
MPGRPITTNGKAATRFTMVVWNPGAGCCAWPPVCRGADRLLRLGGVTAGSGTVAAAGVSGLELRPGFWVRRWSEDFRRGSRRERGRGGYQKHSCRGLRLGPTRYLGAPAGGRKATPPISVRLLPARPSRNSSAGSQHRRQDRRHSQSHRQVLEHGNLQNRVRSVVPNPPPPPERV